MDDFDKIAAEWLKSKGWSPDWEDTDPRVQLCARWAAEDLATLRATLVRQVIDLINHAREEGETDLRQVRNWVEGLATDA